MRVAFDIGGTFTDVVVLSDNGQVQFTKVLSLIDRVGEDIVTCIERHKSSERVEHFVHATTTASNAVIEGKTSTTALLTTEGFRDVLEMMNQKGSRVLDPRWTRLPPLVPRHLRLEVRERVLADGTVERPLDPKDAERAITALRDFGVHAIAISLINSYLNPVHERALAGMVRDLAPKMRLALSSEVNPEGREYERTSTTVINASLLPVVNNYLDQLEGHLAKYSTRLLIMQSNGGTMSSALARQRPIYMVESGPAAGVLAAARLATELDLSEVLSFDMGGTTAKACLIQNGRPMEKAAGEIGGGVSAVRVRGMGHALRVSSVDIVEVGAGGGSMIWIDDAGALRVGPVSAGADPGPVCYGRGGDTPTVTDANVALGYMNPEAIADKTLPIDRAGALEAIRKQVAEPLKLEVMAAAYGIIQVANATMTRALRAVSTERGHDIRNMTLVAFGGSGPIHAAALCEGVGIRKVVIPPRPGLFSALGLLLADTRLDYVRTLEQPVLKLTRDRIDEAYREMEAQARREFVVQNIPTVNMRFERIAEVRVGFMRDEMTLILEGEDSTVPKGIETQFRQAHEREFGFPGEGELYLVNLRLRARTGSSPLSFSDLQKISAQDSAAERRTRLAYFGGEVGEVATSIVNRASIDQPIRGPLIIEEPDTTVVVPPGWTAGRDRFDCIFLRCEAG